MLEYWYILFVRRLSFFEEVWVGVLIIDLGVVLNVFGRVEPQHRLYIFICLVAVSLEIESPTGDDGWGKLSHANFWGVVNKFFYSRGGGSIMIVNVNFFEF